MDHLESLNSDQEGRGEAGIAFFALYENLLDESALLKWHKIVQKQISITPWTNLNSNSHTTAHQKTVSFF